MAKRIVDLSYTVEPHWRPVWKNGLAVREDFSQGDDFRATTLTMECHCFTHVDGSLHFVPGGTTVDQFPAEKRIGKGVIIDLAEVGPNQPVTADLLDKHASFVQEGDMVLLNTLWYKKRSHTTKEFWTEAPYMETDACHWLVERKVKAVGYDFPPDYCIRYPYLNPPKKAKAEEAVTHDIILREEILIIEYLTNLGELRNRVVDLYVLPLKVKGAEGMPCRVVAIEEV